MNRCDQKTVVINICSYLTETRQRKCFDSRCGPCDWFWIVDIGVIKRSWIADVWRDEWIRYNESRASEAKIIGQDKGTTTRINDGQLRQTYSAERLGISTLETTSEMLMKFMNISYQAIIHTAIELRRLESPFFSTAIPSLCKCLWLILWYLLAAVYITLKLLMGLCKKDLFQYTRTYTWVLKNVTCLVRTNIEDVFFSLGKRGGGWIREKFSYYKSRYTLV